MGIRKIFSKQDKPFSVSQTGYSGSGTATTTPAQIIATQTPLKSGVKIINRGANNMYIGGENVSTSSFYLKQDEAAMVNIDDISRLWVGVSSGTSDYVYFGT